MKTLVRAGTTVQWAAPVNGVPAANEIIFNTTTGELKIGDGTTAESGLDVLAEVGAIGGGGGGLSDVVDDTSPQLGGNLDLNGHTVGTATATDLTKLHAVTASAAQLSAATANSPDATLLARANHTGTQSSSTIADLTEAVQDIVGAFLASGAGVTVTYDDAGNTLTVAASGGTTDPEVVRDTIGVALAGIGLITVTVNDAADTITISTTATANDTDANLKNRANHTGTQSADTIVDGATNAAYTLAERTALGNKVDKVTTANRVYIVDGSSVQTVGAYTSAATASAFVRRDANGRAQFVDPTAAADVVTKNYVDVTERAATRTLTNARITPRVNSAASNATPALDAAYDGTVLTAQAAAITAFSLTNSFTAEQKHMIRIKDNGTARAITWTSTIVVAADGITLPTTTVVGKTHRIGCIYDEVVGKLIAVAVGTY